VARGITYMLIGVLTVQIVVALGLVIFGIYSLCEARWRKIQPG